MCNNDEQNTDVMDVDATDDVLVKNYGEFSLTLNKINGSLGFSLRSDPEDTTALR